MVGRRKLAEYTIYRARLKGGNSGVKDLAGNRLASNYRWSLETVAYYQPLYCS